MFGIQFNKNMSRERWEELHDLDIESWGFPLSVENAFLNAGCRNTGEVIDLTENEIKECIELIRSSNPEVVHKEKFEQVMEILHRENIVLPTEEEKKAIRESLTEVQKLQEEIRLLKRENEDLLLEQWFLSQMDEIRSAKKTFAMHAQCIEAFLENGLFIYTDAAIQDVYVKNDDSQFEDLKSKDTIFSCLVCKDKEIWFAIDFEEEKLADSFDCQIPILRISLADWRYIAVEDMLGGWIKIMKHPDIEHKYIYDPERKKEKQPMSS